MEIARYFFIGLKFKKLQEKVECGNICQAKGNALRPHGHSFLRITNDVEMIFSVPVLSKRAVLEAISPKRNKKLP